MSRASTPTKLPLAVFARVFGMHPLHFEQVYVPGITDLDAHCQHMQFQHEWQDSDAVSREEIARVIAEAESKIENALGYKLAPTWEMDEWKPTDRYYQPEQYNWLASDIRGYRHTVQANWGYFISGGIQAKTLITAGAAIVYTDSNSDTYKETATVGPIATTVVDPNEIAIFYPGKSGDDTWEIRPTNVAISGGSVTITFRRELVVKEDLLEAFDVDDAGAEGTNDAHFLSTVDVYRRYNDPQTQASFLWEPLATNWCASCNGSGCAACAYSAQTGCLITRGDPRRSIVGYFPAEWDNTNKEFDSVGWAVSRQPDIVRLFYYSGWRNKTQRYINRMDPEWERTVAYMAASMLDRPPCSCGADVWKRWRDDFALNNGDADGLPQFRTPTGSGRVVDILNNDFGTRRGEIYAWRKVQKARIGHSGSL